ncbi:unnamed protein product [Enterobius vermicularis]|uniref:Endoribonuclease n=1 Tax=Enterobius vermicularis TaxID=51028 RepID=A0A0N4VGR9_ENTVE|nr:unnamed protein product [Enterobius vermicularis]
MMRLLILSLLLICTQARTINKISASDVTALLNEIARKDVNGGDQNDVVVNFQNMASHTKFDHDNAPSPLFTSVSERVSSTATMKAFQKLQALYTKPDATVADENTPERIDAANAFLDAVLATDVMKTAWEFLTKSGLSTNDAAAFKKQLFSLWFTPFTRATALGSSSFETVFVGETHANDVVGLNYWYRFYLLEQDNKVNYHGWFTRQKGVQMELQFAWGSDHAVMDSFLLGTSPEFDLTIYTVCALANVGIDSVYPSQNGATPTESSHKTKATSSPVVNDKDFQAVVDNMRAADDLFERPVYKALIAMYEAKVFSPDVCVKEPDMNGFRKQYILNVFDTFTNTTVFQLAFKYLQSIGKAGDWASFRPKLWTLWMGTYSRCSGTLGSSGFEHVFSGEWKGSKVDGHHSWVNYYRQEKAGDINYHGYISYDDKLTGTFQYTWGNYLKNVGGFNTGTSPGMR